ncbi:roundabout homolog 3 [Trichonephila clavipes]|nr:roundabout homolog 3 [Trichonephila clavipes]
MTLPSGKFEPQTCGVEARYILFSRRAYTLHTGSTNNERVLREEFRLNPKPVQAAMGESAILECVPPKGHPEPSVRWRKDGEYVNTNKGRFRIVSPGNLVVSDVRQSDEGHYRCVAENMAGFRESAPAAMTVHGMRFRDLRLANPLCEYPHLPEIRQIDELYVASHYHTLK